MSMSKLTGVKKIKAIIYIILGILSLIYYAVCVVWAWSGVSWLWLWLVLAGFCFLRVLSLHFTFPRWLSVAYYTLFIFSAAVFVITECNIIKAMSSSPESDADYIIVLGAAVRGDEPTSPMLLRMHTAYEYMLDNPNTILIASGGQGENENMSEGECIYRYLTDWGIPAERIIIEDRAKNTEQNIKNSFALMDSTTGRVGIVTNSFHMYRALLISDSLGYNNTFAIPAPTLLPLGIHYTVREFFGVLKFEISNIL